MDKLLTEEQEDHENKKTEGINLVTSSFKTQLEEKIILKKERIKEFDQPQGRGGGKNQRDCSIEGSVKYYAGMK